MRYPIISVLKFIFFAIIFCFVFSFVTMHLWNWLMPALFGLRIITWPQALGILVLAKLLFGGFHRHAGYGHRGWKRRMEERWANMTPEERERFRAGMKGRRSCGFPPREEPTAL